MRFFFTFLILLLGSSMYAQSPDCKKFKTGKFGYPTMPGKISLRRDDVQESYNNGKLEMKWKVKWISDCQYELTCIKMLVDSYPIAVGDRILSTIVSTDQDCFTHESVFFNKQNPDGVVMPAAAMCLAKD